MILEGLITESLEIIESIRDKAPLTVAFSGGKDSIVLAGLMRLSDVPHNLIYHDTTIDPPDVRQYIKKYYPQTRFIRPVKNYWQLLLEKWPPSRKYRWCCDYLKHGQDTGSMTLLGIRAEESNKRKHYNIFQKEKGGKKIGVNPILHWPEWAIWEFIEQQSLPWPEIYNYVDRVGCVICPFRNFKTHQIWRSRYPNYYKTFEKYFIAWLASKYDLTSYPVEQAIDQWYRFQGVVYYDKLAGLETE